MKSHAVRSEVCGLIFDHNTIRDISLGSGKLNTEVIRNNYPRPI
jgi:NOL1/NOP2/fmu family ribosome biogenesis protein